MSSMYTIIGPGHTTTISKQWVMVLAALLIWESAWKLVAFWKAARNRQIGWFVAIAILNTVGLLPIIYIFFFQPKPGKDSAERRISE